MTVRRYPEALLNRSHAFALASVGVNAIRLGVMWSGAQPEAQVPATASCCAVDGP
jgi:hypothetical protein